METTLILAALVAVILSVTFVAVMAARSRRPELSLPREDDIEADGGERLMRGLDRGRPSPIERGGDVLDLEPVEPRKRLPPGGEA